MVGVAGVEHVPRPPVWVVLRRGLNRASLAVALVALPLAIFADHREPAVAVLVGAVVLSLVTGIRLPASAIIGGSDRILAPGTVLASRRSMQQDDNDLDPAYFVVQVLVAPPGWRAFRDEKRVKVPDLRPPQPGDRCVVWLVPGRRWVWTCRIVPAERLADTLARLAEIGPEVEGAERLRRTEEVLAGAS